MGTPPHFDIASREDIVRLVDGFYAKVREDELLGPIFNVIAQVDWSAHLPKMYGFWESLLFGRASFKGDPLGVHLALSARATLSSREFGRWVQLFHGTVDELFSGEVAEGAKFRAARIAITMQTHIAEHSVARSGDLRLTGVNDSTH